MRPLSFKFIESLNSLNNNKSYIFARPFWEASVVDPYIKVAETAQSIIRWLTAGCGAGDGKDGAVPHAGEQAVHSTIHAQYYARMEAPTFSRADGEEEDPAGTDGQEGCGNEEGRGSPWAMVLLPLSSTKPSSRGLLQCSRPMQRGPLLRQRGSPWSRSAAGAAQGRRGRPWSPPGSRRSSPAEPQQIETF